MKIIRIGKHIPNTKIWRYFKFDRFMDMVQNEYIYFSSANKFEDPFEGAVSINSFSKQNKLKNSFDDAFAELCRLTKISCWHIEEYESDAMWKIYANFGKGIAITTTTERIISSIKPYKLEGAFKPENLVIGKVNYINLVEKKLDVSMIERFFYKHKIFSWEKEFRLAISLRLAEEFGIKIPAEGILVNVDIKMLIDEIYLGPMLDKHDVDKCMDMCSNLGIIDKVKISDLLGCPNYI